VTRPALLLGGSDRAFRAFIYSLLTVSVRMDRLRARVGQLMGLTGLQYHILMVMAEFEDDRPASVGAVAEALHVTGAYVTMETRKLARLGLIEKRANPDDRRGVLLSLTPSGRAAVDAVAPYLREINDALFEGFGSAEFAQFRRIVERMLPTTDAALRKAERFVADRAPSRRAKREKGDAQDR
jgi:DNA-binding MarR family transcriptional regulator